MYKKVLITGCGSGLGKCLWQEFNKHDYIVIPHYRMSRDNCSENGVVGDLNSKGIIDYLKDVLIRNEVDIFINNAAIHSSKDFLDMDDYEIESMVKTNLISQMLLTKRVYKYFKQRNKGTIVNINSITVKNPNPKETIYGACKCGLEGFSKALQLDSMSTGVKIRDFYIGGMKTKMTKHREDYDRLLEPANVASFIYTVLSDDFKDLNTTEFVIRRNLNI